MKTFLDCIPCLIRQSLDSVRLVTTEDRIHEQILREVLQAASRMDFEKPPPVIGQQVHRRIRQLCGDEDPYRQSKDRFNRLAMGLRSRFQRCIEQADDPLEMAVRLAIAGNVMDLGVKSGLSEVEVHAAMDECLSDPLDGNIADFAAAVAEARSILYLTDNAGEIVLDRLLIEQLPQDRVTVAVRGAPVINDATLVDAEAAGLTRLVRVIDNGSDAPGTVLADCSEAFQRDFAEADLIISKGQGNYETLSLGESSQRIYFLLRVKCAVIARDIGFPVGRMVLQRSNPRASLGSDGPRPE